MRYIILASVVVWLTGCSGSDTHPDRQTDMGGKVATYVHPTLDELYPEAGGWQADEASVPFSSSPIEVWLAGGSGSGPSEAALSGYDWLQSHWEHVRGMIQDEAFRFYESYADAVAGVPTFDDPEQLWGTEVLLSIDVFSKDRFSVTLRFAWQKDEDPHEVTFYVEDGRCRTHSADG